MKPLETTGVTGFEPKGLKVPRQVPFPATTGLRFTWQRFPRAFNPSRNPPGLSLGLSNEVRPPQSSGYSNTQGTVQAQPMNVPKVGSMMAAHPLIPVRLSCVAADTASTFLLHWRNTFRSSRPIRTVFLAVGV